ncbi:anti-sigma regulatory factor [Amycolatopsis sp. 195334CR]|uniref:anti-sigma regulatory factor n=1 Tax=Amycolatopsis sp. 195334CR TaxID=2814588 RepID=UPI001A8EAB4D|nr:anti-sigma regulatory factor [Amycolatopsis sp. 195334CR]MBN6033698.1 anti-sigma regulatory factor [Amycolatopsis sp. 195334CR]
MLPDQLAAGEEHQIRVEEDLLTARHAVRASAVSAGFSIVDQTKIVTAASELVRNAYIHGGGGTLTITVLRDRARVGLRLRVRDRGPGIPDVDQAMTDGFSTGAGLGHGLGGTRRLVDDFGIDTGPGGTTVTAVRWKPR